MVSRLQKNPGRMSCCFPFPPVQQLPASRPHPKPSTVLSSSPLGLILKKRSEKHLQKMLLEKLAANKSRTQEKHFVQHQERYYGQVLPERDDRLSTFFSSKLHHRRELSDQKMNTRSKFIEKIKNEDCRRRKEAHQHFKLESQKLEMAHFRKSSYCSPPHSSRSRSSTVRKQQQLQEHCFSESVLRDLLNKEHRVAKNLSELTERRRKKERQLQLRLSNAHNRKKSLDQQFEQNSLLDFMSGMARSQAKLQQIHTIEMSLLADRSRQQTDNVRRVQVTRQQTQRAREERILREIELKNKKIQEAEERRHIKKSSGLKTSSHHMRQVLDRGKHLKEHSNYMAHQETLRKTLRYEQIQVFKLESERIRQMHMASKHTQA